MCGDWLFRQTHDPIMGEFHHFRARDFQKGITRYDEYFSFATIRNPWDRMVSFYEYEKKNGQNIEIISKMSFKEYVEYKSRNSFRNVSQMSWITDNRDHTKIIVDHLVRLERIEEDLKLVVDKFGFDPEIKIGRKNKSRPKNQPYQYYYTNYTKELVRHHFRCDINQFEYEFEEEIPVL